MPTNWEGSVAGGPATPVYVVGSEDDAVTPGADVNVVSTVPIPAGNNNIGDVDVASIAAGETHIGEIGGNLTKVVVEFTRENNATPYGIGDVISSSAGAPVCLELPAAFRKAAGTAYVVGCRVIFNVKSVTPRLRIHLFNVSTATVAGDNLPHKELYAEVSKRSGYFDMEAMNTPADAAGSDMSRGMNMALRHAVVGVSTSIWVLIETLDAVTLTAASKVSVSLILDNN